ncbi:hypothetical protein FACS1894113_2780 [Alphaproteobacteria bacterium]|nr:hypothetical protein FACS1894113_2780 [Alphaproteobacteria bacterium]
MMAEAKSPITIIYLALYLSPMRPKKLFPTPYKTEPIDKTTPMSDFVMLRSEQIAGIANEKFWRTK